ncbi:MAG: hypothetical protein IKL10_05895 [Clostridia bacterium]|nr:hypothetical protein [Clostridia bacterium]
MLDKKFTDEYKSIKAPVELYDRIMNAEKPEVKKSNVVPFGKLASLAAAVAVIIIAGFVFSSDSLPAVYMGTEKLTGEVSIAEESNDALMLARAMNEIKCELTFDIKRETKIFLSEGLLFDEKDNIILEAEKEEVFSEKFSCKWVVPMADESRTYEIRLSDKNGTYFITLSFDRQNGTWTASLTK